MPDLAPLDLVLRGGRVIDPETGTDAIADVGVDGDRIVAIAVADGGPGERSAPLRGRMVLDVRGCIVAPGFIDLHAHAQTLAGHRLQALDGVTTALDLEVGRSPVALGYAAAAAEGMPLHHGFSAAWTAARMHVLAGRPLDGQLETALDGLGDPRWQVAASPEQVRRILALVEADLADGALGIGLPVGYAQGTDVEEYTAAAALAAAASAPTFTHARDLVEVRPDVLVDGAEEVVQAAARTGAHMHYCHVNSTSAQHTDRVLGVLDRAVAEGSRVTVEAYPYGSGMTAVGAQFLAPDQLAPRGLRPDSLTVLATGERIASADRLLELRAAAPGTLVAVAFVEDEAGLADGGFLRRALAAPGTIVASDSVPPVDPADGSTDLPEWPLRPTARAHPRTAGTYTRSLRLLTGAVGEPWSDALARCSLLPARVLESVAPAMRRKGRLQVGADADVVVIDPAVLEDRATYLVGTTPPRQADPRRLSVGGPASGRMPASRQVRQDRRAAARPAPTSRHVRPGRRSRVVRALGRRT
jgi:hypothetical protein